MSARRPARPAEVRDIGRAEPAEDLRHQLEQAASMSRDLTASETAAALANEVSQPLTAILASAQALLRTYQARPQLDPELHEAIEDVAREAFRAAKIVQRMRDIIRRRRARRTRLDVNEVIRSIGGLIHARARDYGVDLTLDLAPCLLPSLGDRAQIQQVVLSLVRNSFEAMEPLPPEERLVRIQTVAAGANTIWVTIEDSGPPVDDDTLGHLFTPFHTSKTDGLGIGLSLCRSIVEAHGGRIEVSRNAGGGLTVRFSVPAEAPTSPF